MGLFARKLHPEWFQGNFRKRFYFEGWYFKIIDKSSDNIYAIIPGIALNKKSQNSHAFIQILNGKTAEYNYISFPLSKFHVEKNRFAVTIGKNSFSREKTHIDIDNEIKINGDLEFRNWTSLQRKFWNPGVMRPFTWLPFMETNHAVLSMNHTINGSLEVNGKQMDFSNGKGYIEKDWGTSFPSNWIWMQSNHFEEQNRSFMFSVGKVRYLGLKFTGFLGVLWDGDEMIRFGTYSGAKICNLEITPKQIRLEIHTRKDILEVIASKSVDETGSTKTAAMMTPNKGEMTAKCMESISSTIELTHFKTNRKSKELVFHDIGINAGFEIMGSNSDFF